MRKRSCFAAVLLLLAFPAFSPGQATGNEWTSGDQFDEEVVDPVHGDDWTIRAPRTMNLVAEIVEDNDPKLVSNQTHLIGTEIVLRQESGADKNVFGAIVDVVQQSETGEQQNVIMGLQTRASIINDSIVLDNAWRDDPHSALVGFSSFVGFSDPIVENHLVSRGRVETLIGNWVNIALDNLGLTSAQNTALEAPDLVEVVIGVDVSIGNGQLTRDAVPPITDPPPSPTPTPIPPRSINTGPIIGLRTSLDSVENFDHAITMDSYTGVLVEAPRKWSGSAYVPDVSHFDNTSYGVYVGGGGITSPDFVGIHSEAPVYFEKSFQVDGDVELGNAISDTIEIRGAISAQGFAEFEVDESTFSIYGGNGAYVILDPQNETADIHKLNITTSRGVLIEGVLETGAHNVKRRAVSTTGTIATTDYYVSCGVKSTAITLTLPSASTAGSGRILVIKDAAGEAATRSITVAAASTQTIDGAASKVINANYQSLMLISNGSSNWEIVN